MEEPQYLVGESDLAEIAYQIEMLARKIASVQKELHITHFVGTENADDIACMRRDASLLLIGIIVMQAATALLVCFLLRA